MNYVHPAVFYEEEGKISVIFPDLGNLSTLGDNVADAMRMTVDAYSQYLSAVRLTRLSSIQHCIFYTNEAVKILHYLHADNSPEIGPLLSLLD